MIEFGCLARHDHLLAEDVLFAKNNNFRILQIWYDRNGISLKKEMNQIESIIKNNFPCIIHAVLDINEFDFHVPKLLTILKSLNHKELIIHPICTSETINQETMHRLSEKIKNADNFLSVNGIQLLVENNSRIDPILNSIRDMKILFSENPNVELLLDIAHIDSYEHLEEIIKVKYPRLLHLADRHLERIHEHLPIGRGNINFRHIFSDILFNYEGMIILEITQSNEELVDSKNRLDFLLNRKKTSASLST